VVYTLRVHTYIRVQFIYIYVGTILYASRRVNRRHPRRLRPADYSRAPASLALSPANGRRCTAVTKIPRLLPLCNNFQLSISATAAVLLSGCVRSRLYRLASGCVGSAGIARDVYNYIIILQYCNDNTTFALHRRGLIKIAMRLSRLRRSLPLSGSGTDRATATTTVTTACTSPQPVDITACG